jgi:hypothetical protein
VFLGRNPVGCRHVGEGQQFVDAAHRMSGDDLREHVAQIELRIDVIHLAGFDERGNDRPVLAAAVGAGEEMVFAPERNLAVILPISGRMSSSIIAGILCTVGACVVFRASGAHQVMSYTWSCRPAP